MVEIFNATMDPSSGSGTSSSACNQLAQCRLFAFSLIDLRILPYGGNLLAVGQELLVLPPSGLACLNTTTRINAQGLDTGIVPAADQLLHAYVSNSRASFAPRELRLALIGPTLVNPDRPSSLYLGTSENAAQWRYVGSLYTNSLGLFVDGPSERLVASWYNRQRKSLFVCPGFNAAGATISAAAASDWTLLHPAAVVRWLQLSDDSATLFAHAQPAAWPANIGQLRFALQDEAGDVRASVLGGGSMQFGNVSATGLGSASLVYTNTTGGAVNLQASLAPAGGNDDSAPATYLAGSVLV